MSCSRRSFLKKSSLLASGVALSTLPFMKGCASAAAETAPFGLQLYTLRDILPDDPKGVLRQVADYGYRQIESYEGPDGMFWGMGHTGFRQYLNELGMEMISSHANVFENVDRKIEEIAEIGGEFIVCPWAGPQESLDDFRRIAEQFNEIGEKARKAGIRFAYHNHGYTFGELEGALPQDVLMEGTDPDLVEYQMDIYWVVAAGEDPAAWIRKYPNRFTSGHVKDYISGEDGESESTVLGTGTIDFPPLLDLAKQNGMEYFIIEQEAYTGTTPLDAIRQNALYMKELGI